MEVPTIDRHPIACLSFSSARLDLLTIDGSGKVVSIRSNVFIDSRSAIDQIQELVNNAGSQFSTIGVSVPGLVDASGAIRESRISGLTGIDLKREIGEIFGGRMIVENDANASAYAEWKIGAGINKDIFRVSIGEGVGAGIVLNGKLWRGSFGYAGEIGSIVVDDEGNRLEDIASVSNIVRRTRNRFHQDSTSILNKLNENEIGLKDIIAAAAAEDDLALLMFERTGIAIGSAVGAVLNAMNIETVIIAGEPTHSNPVLLNAIKSRIRDCTSSAISEGTEILVSDLGENAAAIGAGLLAADAFLSE